MSELPVIRVDDAHHQVERAEGNEPEIYKLPAGPGFILDATGYNFRIPPGLGHEPPNLIQLVRGAGNMYAHPWHQGKTKYVLTGDTLRPSSESTTLRMFEAGEVLTLAIGRYVPDDQRTALVSFYPYWITLICVS